LWGEESVLHVEHLSPPRTFRLGEDDSEAESGVDYVIGSQSLGAVSWPLVLHDDAGGTRVVLPEGATCEAVRAGVSVPAEELAQRASGELPGAREIELGRDLWVRVTHRGFSFVVRDLPAESLPLAAPLMALDVKEQKGLFASLAGHAFVLAMFWFLPPYSTARSADILHTDSRLIQYAIEKNQDPPPPDVFAPADKKNDGGSASQAAKNDRGRHGNPSAKHDCNDCRNKATPAPQTREELKALAAKSGIVSYLGTVAAQMTGGSSLYAAANAENGDANDALLALLGPNEGEARGLFGGLSSIGTGHGGGGNAEGTLGADVTTVGGHGGHGGPGYGEVSSSLRNRNAKIPPRIVPGNAKVTGSLRKETIRRVIGQHINEVRFCYTQALIGKPDLQGRVVVQFVISPQGTVMTAIVRDSDLGDFKVASCVADVVKRAVFPQPEGGGLVQVSYPFVLSQVGN
jgi:hypothetical protein